MKGALKSKTIWFSAVLAVLGVLEMQAALVRELVGDQNFGAVMLGVGVISAVLRVVTTQALTEK